MENLNVLLVEDDSLNQFLFQKLLKNQPFTFEIADDGQVAIEMLKSKVFHIVFMDINMPVMNGFEFLTAFEQLEIEDRSSVIIVMLTTSMNPEDIKIAQETTIGGYLNKPLTENDLQKVWEKFFGD